MDGDAEPQPISQTRDLTERARAGDRAALQALMVEHLPSMVAFVRLQAGPQIRNKESVSDLVQSACVAALGDLSSFEYRSDAEFRHWLCVQALRKIQNKDRFYRTRRRDAAREVPMELATVYASMCTPSEAAAAREHMALVEQAFDTLPADYREAVVLRRIVGLSYDEIAGRLGRSVGSVRNLVSRGTARLAMRIEEQERT